MSQVSTAEEVIGMLPKATPPDKEDFLKSMTFQWQYLTAVAKIPPSSDIPRGAMQSELVGDLLETHLATFFGETRNIVGGRR